MWVFLKKNVDSVFANIFFCVDMVYSGSTIFFSFTHIVDVALAKLPTPNKIVSIKEISSHKKNDSKKVFLPLIIITSANIDFFATKKT